jgi:signal transduction histidine kinase/streptogramin lyase
VSAAALRIALLAGALAAAAAAQTRPLQRIDIGRGLAGDRVYDFALDHAGFLWIATGTGLSRFDGAEFRTFDVRHGLAHPTAPRLLVARDGRLWAGSNKGLAVIVPVAGDGPQFRRLETPLERQGGRFAALAEDLAGTIWAGSDLALQRIVGAPGEERLEPVPGPTGPRRIAGLVADPRGGLWVADDRGLDFRLPDGAWIPWGKLPPLIDNRDGSTDLALDGRDRLWLSARLGLCVVPFVRDAAGTPRPVPLEPLPIVPLERLGDGSEPRAACSDVERGLPRSVSPRVLRSLPDGRVLAAAAGGVLELGPAGARLVFAPEPDQPFEPSVAFEVADGSLWVGTRTTGLLRLPASGLLAFGPRESVSGNLSHLAAPGGSPFVVLDAFEANRRLLRWDGERFREVTPPGAESFELHFSWGATSTIGRDGAWWVASRGALLRHAPRADGGFERGRPFAPPAIARELAAVELFRVFADSKGAIWAAGDTPPSLFRVDPATGEGRRHDEIAALEYGPPTAFAEAPDGTLWIGFYMRGLARLRDGRVERVGTPEGLPQGFAYSLVFDRRGRLWIGTGGSGLVRIDDPSAASPTARSALPGSALESLQVYDLVEDPLGRMLAATARGVFLINPEAGIVDTLTSADGLPVSWVSALARGEGGAIWIGTERGVARFVAPTGEPAPPPIRVSAVSVAGRPVALPIDGAERVGELELSSADRTVEIEVVSPHLFAGALPRFQWRTGESDWSAPSADRRLRLAGLSPGRLRIEARAVGAQGRTSEAPATVELYLQPPLWRRSWFLAASAALIAAALVAAYRLRVGRLLALERVRTRIAADLHDDLGASLSRISILAEVARRQGPAGGAGEATLEEIGRTARELAEMAGDIVWAIDPQRDDLGSLVSRLRRFGSDLFEPSGVRFAIDAPVDAGAIRLGAAERRDLYLLLKEGLANAAKYAGARQVAVSIARAGERLRVELLDDGGGFDAGAPERAVARGGGHGLSSMRERAARLGGELQLVSEQGRGTRLALELPL